MGGAPDTSANLSCLGLKRHGKVWEPRSSRPPVGRPSRREAAPISDARLERACLRCDGWNFHVRKFVESSWDNK
jgi:hypothetical protein